MWKVNLFGKLRPHLGQWRNLKENLQKKNSKTVTFKSLPLTSSRIAACVKVKLKSSKLSFWASKNEIINQYTNRLSAFNFRPTSSHFSHVPSLFRNGTKYGWYKNVISWRFFYSALLLHERTVRRQSTADPAASPDHLNNSEVSMKLWSSVAEYEIHT